MKPGRSSSPEHVSEVVECGRKRDKTDNKDYTALISTKLTTNGHSPESFFSFSVNTNVVDVVFTSHVDVV
jgi:hypothetical protein